MYYETVFIINPDVSKENTETLTDALVKRVEKAGGRIVKREYWGSRPLAYQIAKRKRGHYILLVTDGEFAAEQALEEGLRLEERVLRFLTTRLQELSDEPSPLLLRQMKSAEAAKSADVAVTDNSEEDKSVGDKPVEDKPAQEKVETAATEIAKDDGAPEKDTVEKETAKEPVKQSGESAEAGGDAAA